MNRREFMVGSAAALVIAAGGGSYVFSRCPLDTDETGVCTGPCLAFIDWDGDGHCDRVPAPVLVSSAGSEGNGPQGVALVERVCPFGWVDDPYPGQCHLYVDENGDGLCDLSQGVPTTTAAEGGPPAPSAEAAGLAPTATALIQTACPLGLVNDPHPGECRRYIDENGNGLCDLSEPALSASGAVVPLPTPPAVPEQEDGIAPTQRPVTACPYGLVNDPYPGECRRYVDANGNGLCDLSEPDWVAAGDWVAPTEAAGTDLHQGQGQGQQRRRGQ
jgi:hypothetical protein